MDYKEKNLFETVGKADTVFIHDVPLDVRSRIVRFCYKNKINIYFNPEIEDIVENTICSMMSLYSTPM